VAKILGFITLVAMLVFAMGLVTHPKGTASIINSTSNGLVKLFTLELGKVPGSKSAAA
jgi:hypothetical protein